jgi:hypothetical protein
MDQIDGCSPSRSGLQTGAKRKYRSLAEGNSRARTGRSGAEATYSVVIERAVRLPTLNQLLYWTNARAISHSGRLRSTRERTGPISLR